MEEFKKILALQHEIDQKLDEFITRTKAILQSERAKGHERIIVELEGELYELTKQNETRQAMETLPKTSRLLSRLSVSKAA
jgi:hypothetical protein